MCGPVVPATLALTPALKRAAMIDRSKYAKIEAYADECILFIGNLANDPNIHDPAALKEVATVLQMMKVEMDFLVNDLDRVLTTAQKNDALAANTGVLPAPRSLKEFAGQTFGAQILGQPSAGAMNDFRKYVESFADAQKAVDALGVSPAEREKKLKELIAAKQQAMVVARTPVPLPVSGLSPSVLALDDLDDEKNEAPPAPEPEKEYPRDTSKWASDDSYSGHGGDSGGAGASASWDSSPSSSDTSSSSSSFE